MVIMSPARHVVQHAFDGAQVFENPHHGAFDHVVGQAERVAADGIRRDERVEHHGVRAGIGAGQGGIIAVELPIQSGRLDFLAERRVGLAQKLSFSAVASPLMRMASPLSGNG